MTSRDGVRPNTRSPLYEEVGKRGHMRSLIHSLLIERGKLSLTQIADLLNISRRSASERLRELVKRGKVRVIGVVSPPACYACGHHKSGRPEKLYEVIDEIR